MQFHTVIEPFHIKTVEPICHIVNSLKGRIRGVKIVEAPEALRHFSARLAPAHGQLVVDTPPSR